MEEFVVDKMVTASGFTPELGSLSDLPLAKVLYEYDTLEGETLILESNNAIYLRSKMTYLLVNPIQSEENDVKIDIRPQRYYPDIWTAQSITFPDGKLLKVKYNGVLSYIPICCPINTKIHNCRQLQLNSRAPLGSIHFQWKF